MDIRQVDARPKEIVTVLKARYPKYDKYLHSKVCRPEKHGIKLIPQAERILRDSFKINEKCHKFKDNHTRVHQITFRPENGQYDALQQARNEDGFATWQAFFQNLVDEYLEGRF